MRSCSTPPRRHPMNIFTSSPRLTTFIFKPPIIIIPNSVSRDTYLPLKVSASLFQRLPTSVAPPLAAATTIGPSPKPRNSTFHKYRSSPSCNSHLLSNHHRKTITITYYSTIANMGAKDVLSRKAGVIVGDDVLKLFNHAQENNYAIPAIVSLPLHPGT